MAAMESEKMTEKMKEFMSNARPGQMFNFCEGEMVDGTRSLTVYEVSNQEWFVKCPCGQQQYPGDKCRMCGKDLVNLQEKGREFIESIRKSAADPEREAKVKALMKAAHTISAEEMNRPFTV